MKDRFIIQISIFFSAVSLGIALMLSIAGSSASESKWFTFGWHDKLYVVSMKIDTWYKYITMLSVFGFMAFSKVIDTCLSQPILWFILYGPSKFVRGITRFEVNVYTWVSTVLSQLRDLLLLMVSITQVDIGLFCILSGLLGLMIMTTVLTYRKVFTSSDGTPYVKQTDEEELEEMEELKREEILEHNEPEIKIL